MLGPQTKIDSISIKGFRSLADVSVSCLSDVVVMIGPNGSGKSNVIRFFEMLNWMLKSRRLAEFVARNGGADDQLFGGSKRTSKIEAAVGLQAGFGKCNYSFSLTFTRPDEFTVADQTITWGKDSEELNAWHRSSPGRSESDIVEDLQSNRKALPSRRSLLSMVRLLTDHQTYQFHDTSDTSQHEDKLGHQRQSPSVK